MTDTIVALFLVGAGLVVLLLLGLARAAGKRPAPQPPQRRVYRCAASTGRAACTAPATRIVIMVTGPTEARVMCDQDAQRECRIGRAVDMGPIGGRR